MLECVKTVYLLHMKRQNVCTYKIPNCQYNIYCCCFMHLAPTCASDIPLVNGPVPIPDAQFTASSQWDFDNYGPHKARFNTTTSWCTSGDDANYQPSNMFIQVGVKTGKDMLLSKVIFI